MTPTLRRLDDRERYWGLPWPGWVATSAGAAALYLAVRFSPLGTKPTITITLFILAFAGMVLYGVSGQALSPGRQLLAILSYHRSRKLLELADRVERRGLVLDSVPRNDAPIRHVDGHDDENDDLFSDRVGDEDTSTGGDGDVGGIAAKGRFQHSPDEHGRREDAQPPSSSREGR